MRLHEALGNHALYDFARHWAATRQAVSGIAGPPEVAGGMRGAPASAPKPANLLGPCPETLKGGDRKALIRDRKLGCSPDVVA